MYLKFLLKNKAFHRENTFFPLQKSPTYSIIGSWGICVKAEIVNYFQCARIYKKYAGDFKISPAVL